ncbi:TetR/AcrR family transcriptional regulator [Mangrovicoccus sp. HB161399]|uniref:TetR/AcrR family transcriptional regulator n=1 Tax=Mangrovicoccus sp. HB161399 TaxID=2720392 RepID=UPI001556CE86|nr:TetR/AcrR family transcriptional regulator [Mangrovicoccus sp. HB161399]
MTEDTLPERGWRGSPEVWLDAAYEALVGKGVDAVKIMPLANALKLSRTSFYWFFKDRNQLLSQLLERWEQTTTRVLVAAAEEPAATETMAMLNVISTFLPDAGAGFDARIELAVRAWAQQDPAVLARLQAADAGRLQALKALLERWGHAAADADVRARAIYLVQVGYISMRVEESLEDRLARFPAYVEIYTGKKPTAEEMARTAARLRRPGGGR